MDCDHRLIQKQWMLGQVGYEDSCPECDKKRIAELDRRLDYIRLHQTDPVAIRFALKASAEEVFKASEKENER